MWSSYQQGNGFSEESESLQESDQSSQSSEEMESSQEKEQIDPWSRIQDKAFSCHKAKLDALQKMSTSKTEIHTM